MKIQISPTRILPGYLTIWNQPGPEVDLVMDVRKLTFRPGSLEEIFSPHVLDHIFPEEINDTLSNWHECLMPNGKLFILINDFEYICRGFVGGDIDINLINKEYCCPTFFNKENSVGFLRQAGFIEDNLVIWYESIPEKINKRPFELLFEAKKI